jgi:hypothetical protein
LHFDSEKIIRPFVVGISILLQTFLLRVADALRIRPA